MVARLIVFVLLLTLSQTTTAGPFTPIPIGKIPPRISPPPTCRSSLLIRNQQRNQQVLRSVGQIVDILSSNMRGSVIFSGSTDTLGIVIIHYSSDDDSPKLRAQLIDLFSDNFRRKHTQTDSGSRSNSRTLIEPGLYRIRVSSFDCEEPTGTRCRVDWVVTHLKYSYDSRGRLTGYTASVNKSARELEAIVTSVIANWSEKQRRN